MILAMPVNSWNKSDSFLEMKNFAKSLKITNDTAERGVKMITDYAQTITKDESQRQALLQVVQEHRKLHPGQSKSNFMNRNSVLFHI